MTSKHRITIPCKQCDGDGVHDARHPMWGSPSCPEAYVQVECDECEGSGEQWVNVKTSHDFPPIPVREFDWSAIDADNYDEGSPIGRGSTEAEAIADLKQQLESEDA